MVHIKHVASFYNLEYLEVDFNQRILLYSILDGISFQIFLLQC